MRSAGVVLAVTTACVFAAGSVTACAAPAGGARAAGATGTAAVSFPAHGRSYYLSLGDSLSRGVQPDAGGSDAATRQGYPDQLQAALRRGTAGLRLVKLGCSGETTATMMRGGRCRYGGGSQLAAADAFLRAHRGRTALVTIDIGANDPNSCTQGFSAPRITAGDLARCLNSQFRATLANLAAILARLRAAGGSAVPVIGMNYYVPELAGWLDGHQGKLIAAVSERLAAAYNQLLAGVYRHYGARVADVFGAFHSADFGAQMRLPGKGILPRNVAAVCQWTWICAAPPRGPDEHANKAGYAVIARAFLRAART